MYEEEKTFRVGINWKDLIIKLLLLVLFVFLLLWLFPQPKLDTFYDQVFNDNLQTMKDSARNYYTKDRLPANIGDSTSMTLQEMINNKMILPFVDKNNKTCDLNNSYIQVTKTTDTEYVLKVQLSCENQTDYILDTIGCYDLCPSGDCEVDEEKPDAQKTLQYQFKKLVNGSSSKLTCPSGYTLSGSKCYKTIESSRVAAKKEYFSDSTTVTDAKTNSTGSYTQYVSPNITSGSVSYTCPSGYERIGSMCYYYVNPSKTSGTNGYYTCPNDGNLSGSTCVLTASYQTSSTAGSPYAAKESIGSQWLFKKVETHAYTLTTYENKTERRFLTNQVYKPTCSASVTNCYTYATYYTYQTDYKKVTYSCSNGDRLSGKTCYPSGTTTKTCPSGYTNTGSTCQKTYAATYVNGTSGSTTCPSGYKYNGSKCYISTSATRKTESNSYSCPSGYKKSGSGASTTCYRTISGSSSTYCTDADATLKNGKCYKTTKGGFKGYSCSSDMILDGESCYKTTNDVKNADKSTTSTSYYKYTWSSKSSLSGWTSTGKTRYV